MIDENASTVPNEMTRQPIALITFDARHCHLFQLILRSQSRALIFRQVQGLSEIALTSSQFVEQLTHACECNVKCGGKARLRFPPRFVRRDRGTANVARGRLF